jgi:hypothetical protein
MRLPVGTRLSPVRNNPPASRSPEGSAAAARPRSSPARAAAAAAPSSPARSGVGLGLSGVPLVTGTRATPATLRALQDLAAAADARDSRGRGGARGGVYSGSLSLSLAAVASASSPSPSSPSLPLRKQQTSVRATPSAPSSSSSSSSSSALAQYSAAVFATLPLPPSSSPPLPSSACSPFQYFPSLVDADAAVAAYRFASSGSVREFDDDDAGGAGADAFVDSPADAAAAGLRCPPLRGVVFAPSDALVPDGEESTGGENGAPEAVGLDESRAAAASSSTSSSAAPARHSLALAHVRGVGGGVPGLPPPSLALLQVHGVRRPQARQEILYFSGRTPVVVDAHAYLPLHCRLATLLEGCVGPDGLLLTQSPLAVSAPLPHPASVAGGGAASSSSSSSTSLTVAAARASVENPMRSGSSVTGSVAGALTGSAVAASVVGFGPRSAPMPGRKQRVFPGHTQPLSTVAAHPFLPVAASAQLPASTLSSSSSSSSAEIRVWHTNTLADLTVPLVVSIPAAGGAGTAPPAVSALAFSPDGRYLCALVVGSPASRSAPIPQALAVWDVLALDLPPFAEKNDEEEEDGDRDSGAGGGGGAGDGHSATPASPVLVLPCADISGDPSCLVLQLVACTPRPLGVAVPAPATASDTPSTPPWPDVLLVEAHAVRALAFSRPSPSADPAARITASVTDLGVAIEGGGPEGSADVASFSSPSASSTTPADTVGSTFLARSSISAAAHVTLGGSGASSAEAVVVGSADGAVRVLVGSTVAAYASFDPPVPVVSLAALAVAPRLGYPDCADAFVAAGFADGSVTIFQCWQEDGPGGVVSLAALDTFEARDEAGGSTSTSPHAASSTSSLSPAVSLSGTVLARPDGRFTVTLALCTADGSLFRTVRGYARPAADGERALVTLAVAAAAAAAAAAPKAPSTDGEGSPVPAATAFSSSSSSSSEAALEPPVSVDLLDSSRSAASATTVAAHPYLPVYALATREGTVQVWDATIHVLLGELPLAIAVGPDGLPAPSRVLALDFAHDGCCLAVGTEQVRAGGAAGRAGAAVLLLTLPAVYLRRLELTSPQAKAGSVARYKAAHKHVRQAAAAQARLQPHPRGGGGATGPSRTYLLLSPVAVWTLPPAAGHVTALRFAPAGTAQPGGASSLPGRAHVQGAAAAAARGKASSSSAASIVGGSSVVSSVAGATSRAQPAPSSSPLLLTLALGASLGGVEVYVVDPAAPPGAPSAAQRRKALRITPSTPQLLVARAVGEEAAASLARVGVVAIDWDVGGRYLRVCASSYELAFWEAASGARVKNSEALRDVGWAGQSSPLGWGVTGVWHSSLGPGGAQGARRFDEVLAVARNTTGADVVATAGGDGAVRLFNLPAQARPAAAAAAAAGAGEDHGGGASNKGRLGARGGAAVPRGRPAGPAAFLRPAPHSVHAASARAPLASLAFTAGDERLVTVAPGDACGVQLFDFRWDDSLAHAAVAEAAGPVDAPAAIAQVTAAALLRPSSAAALADPVRDMARRYFDGVAQTRATRPLPHSSLAPPPSSGGDGVSARASPAPSDGTRTSSSSTSTGAGAARPLRVASFAREAGGRTGAGGGLSSSSAVVDTGIVVRPSAVGGSSGGRGRGVGVNSEADHDEAEDGDNEEGGTSPLRRIIPNGDPELVVASVVTGPTSSASASASPSAAGGTSGDNEDDDDDDKYEIDGEEEGEDDGHDDVGGHGGGAGRASLSAREAQPTLSPDVSSPLRSSPVPSLTDLGSSVLDTGAGSGADDDDDDEDGVVGALHGGSGGAAVKRVEMRMLASAAALALESHEERASDARKATLQGYAGGGGGGGRGGKLHLRRRRAGAGGEDGDGGGPAPEAATVGTGEQ